MVWVWVNLYDVGMRPRRDVDPALVENWDRLRTESAARFVELIAAGPDPVDGLLEHLAWRSGLPEPEPFDVERVRLVMRAIEARCTWRELALALGYGEAGIQRCQSVYNYRARVLEREGDPAESR